MPSDVELAERMRKYLEKIYPESATKKEIFTEVGVRACAGDTWLRTLVVNRDVQVVGKKGRYNLYRFEKK